MLNKPSAAPTRVATADADAVPAIPYLAAQAAKILVSIAAIVVAPEPNDTVTEVPPTPKVHSS